MSKPIFNLAVLSALGIALAGCGKKPVADPVAPEPEVKIPDAAPVQPAYQPPAPPPISAAPESGPDLKAINHAYIGWIVQNRRRPKSFEEFVSASGMQVPPPPAGKKYVIDRTGFIALVNQ